MKAKELINKLLQVKGNAEVVIESSRQNVDYTADLDVSVDDEGNAVIYEVADSKAW